MRCGRRLPPVVAVEILDDALLVLPVGGVDVEWDLGVPRGEGHVVGRRSALFDSICGRNVIRECGVVGHAHEVTPDSTFGTCPGVGTGSLVMTLSHPIVGRSAQQRQERCRYEK
jgi:hypothetical protein